MAERRNGPAEALAIARVTTGFASAPSVVALEIMTIAMVMPAMPVMAPANATRASVQTASRAPHSRAPFGSSPRSAERRSLQAASRTHRRGFSTGCHPPSSSSPDPARRSRARRRRSQTSRSGRERRRRRPTGRAVAAMLSWERVRWLHYRASSGERSVSPAGSPRSCSRCRGTPPR